jgi:hypothetical protein
VASQAAAHAHFQMPRPSSAHPRPAGAYAGASQQAASSTALGALLLVPRTSLNSFDFEFVVLNFVLNLNLSENTNTIRSNVENEVVWYRIFLYCFHPYMHLTCPLSIDDFSVSHPPLASTGSFGIHYSYIQHKVAISRYIQTIELATSDKRQVAIN